MKKPMHKACAFTTKKCQKVKCMWAGLSQQAGCGNPISSTAIKCVKTVKSSLHSSSIGVSKRTFHIQISVLFASCKKIGTNHGNECK